MSDLYHDLIDGSGAPLALGDTVIIVAGVYLGCTGYINAFQYDGIDTPVASLSIVAGRRDAVTKPVRKRTWRLQRIEATCDKGL